MPALIFDCDGVLADTERFGHLPAFNQMFREFGLPVSWSAEEYGRLLAIGGGKERLSTVLTPEFISAAGLPTDRAAQQAEIARWHRRKTEIYTGLVDSGMIPTRTGISRIIGEAARAGWQLAVASTSAESSVRAVLKQVALSGFAEKFAVLAGDAVPRKKPAPDIYLLALRTLDSPAEQTLVVEDSAIGFHAATAAGLTCVITVNDYTRDEDFTGAALVVASLGDPGREAVQVISDPAGRVVGDYVTLSDLERCLA